MKKIFFSAIPVAAIALLAFMPINDPLPIGASIPNQEEKMKDISGNDVSFKDAMKKNGLLVMFSCNTCPVVKRLQTRINEICNYAKEKGIGVILLNPNEAYRTSGDSFDDSKDYGNKHDFSWYYVMDDNSKMANAFGATRTPECFLFNEEGKLVYHGAIDDNSDKAEEVTRKHAAIAMDELSAGKEVTQKKTRSVGCTIKRKKAE